MTMSHLTLNSLLLTSAQPSILFSILLSNDLSYSFPVSRKQFWTTVICQFHCALLPISQTVYLSSCIVRASLEIKPWSDVVGLAQGRPVQLTLLLLPAFVRSFIPSPFCNSNKHYRKQSPDSLLPVLKRCSLTRLTESEEQSILIFVFFVFFDSE